MLSGLRRAQQSTERFYRYRYHPERYIKEKLNWEPWEAVIPGTSGQKEILDHYAFTLRQLERRKDYERRGMLPTNPGRRVWEPGDQILNEIRVEAGHTVGKTKLASGIINHFFDCFNAIIYCYAPSHTQIHDLLLKEIKSDRRQAGLPGKINDMEIKLADTRFIKGRATDNSNSAGTERTQGQHHDYLMFVVDEAEGVASFVYDAIRSMTSGGVAIVLYLANPRTRTSEFYRIRNKPEVKNFRISCLHHPNVVTGKELVTGAVRRQYVEGMIRDHCDIVQEHNDDDHTFNLPFPMQLNGVKYDTNELILKPDTEFLFRVAGVPPRNVTDRTFISLGAYEAALERGRTRHQSNTQVPRDVYTAGSKTKNPSKNQPSSSSSVFRQSHSRSRVAHTARQQQEPRKARAGYQEDPVTNSRTRYQTNSANSQNRPRSSSESTHSRSRQQSSSTFEFNQNHSRPLSGAFENELRIGLDVARFGSDVGTVYVRRANKIWRALQLRRLRTSDYVAAVMEVCQEFSKDGINDVQVRIDGGGGFGGGVIDQLQKEDHLHQLFDRFDLVEVNFNAAPHDNTAYADLITNAYGETAESIKGLAIIDAPSELEFDLTARRFKYVNRSGRQVKKLEEKEVFKTEYKRSPDDGDGFVLAAAPDFIFERELANNPGSFSYSMFAG